VAHPGQRAEPGATSATLEEFLVRPAERHAAPRPFANRLDETAFYANDKKYNFDLELGNVRGRFEHWLRERTRPGSSSSSRPTGRARG